MIAILRVPSRVVVMSLSTWFRARAYSVRRLRCPRARVAALATVIACHGAAACAPYQPENPWKDEIRLNDEKEDVNLLVAHCVVFSGKEPLSIAARMQAEDFGPAADSKVEMRWDFGDGESSSKTIPRPLYPEARPVQYRFCSEVKHVYRSAGPYEVSVAVRNGSRSSTCSASIKLLPPDQKISHPQG